MSMNEWNILNHWNNFNLVKVAIFSFSSNEDGFSIWQNEKLSEMLSTIRKSLQIILACIFALRTWEGKKMASTSKIRRMKEEQPRNLKNIVNVWESPLWKKFDGPRYILRKHCSREMITLQHLHHQPLHLLELRGSSVFRNCWLLIGGWWSMNFNSFSPRDWWSWWRRTNMLLRFGFWLFILGARPFLRSSSRHDREKKNLMWKNHDLCGSYTMIAVLPIGDAS